MPPWRALAGPSHFLTLNTGEARSDENRRALGGLRANERAAIPADRKRLHFHLMPCPDSRKPAGRHCGFGLLKFNSKNVCPALAINELPLL
jgi:hypothetical protein